tara:strand:+ start:1342 stop:1602 length:261 start_codon:yes stop_codon:yes gene_type:complete
MKEKQTLPNTPNEHKIALLLGIRGLERKHLDFRYNQYDERFVSFEHWSPIQAEDILYVQTHCNVILNEISWHDDDCGWQFYYGIDS